MNKNSISYSLSDGDINGFLQNKCKIVVYPDLHKYKSLSQLLKPYECVVLLYEMKQDVGHWCCLIDHGDKIEFFDPYGLIVDDELDFIPDDFQNKSNQNHTYLTNLLLNQNKPVEYNHTKLQGKNPKITTCGRWTVARLLFKDWDLSKFVKVMKSDPKLKPDQVVTEFTNDLAHNLRLW